jgi:integrase
MPTPCTCWTLTAATARFMPIPNSPAGIPRPCSPGQYRRRWRHTTMLLVAYRHGLRVSELCALRWEQVDLGQSLLHVRRLMRFPWLHWPDWAHREPGKHTDCS